MEMLIFGSWLWVWLAVAVVTALAAQARGRSFFGWLLIGGVTGVFGLLAVLVMENLKGKAEVPFAPWAHEPDHGPVSGTIKMHRGVAIAMQGKGYRADNRYFETLEKAERYIESR